MLTNTTEETDNNTFNSRGLLKNPTHINGDHSGRKPAKQNKINKTKPALTNTLY